MPTADLTSTQTLDTTNDSVVIVNYIEGIPGGRTLDVTGFTPDTISAGHVIIQEDSSGDYKPLPTSGTLPSGHSYAGILSASVKKDKPFASIMYRGTVNTAYAPYTIASAAQTALSLIKFINQ